jgi:hypothetical protein
VSRASEIQSVHTAYTSGDFLALETLRMMLDPDIFKEGMSLVFATHELEMEDRDRYVGSLVFLAQHAPGMSIRDGIASLSADGLAEYVRIRHGEEPQ